MLKVEMIFPQTDETYIQWITRLQLQDTEAHRHLFFVWNGI